MESAASPNGRVVVRRYHLQERLGQGGMGTVWRAYDELLGRTIAIKEVNLPQLAEVDQAELRQRAMREARAAARLSHPNTITVHDVVEEDGNPWIVMSLVDADSLADVLRNDGPLSPTRVAEIGLAVLSALEEAHAAGILHRDVKPGNILLGTRGRIVLTDFGIATLEGDPAMTTAGLLLGAPAYMAPERVAGLPLGPASDLWSLGATLYAAVEGRPPYDRQSAMATLSALMNEDLPAPQAAGRLTSTLLGLLIRDPALRLDASAARRLLEQALRDPGEHGTRFLPAFAGEPLGGTRQGERTQVVARPATAAGPTGRMTRHLPAPAYAAAPPPVTYRADPVPAPVAQPPPQRANPPPRRADPPPRRANPPTAPVAQPAPKRPSRWWSARIATAAMIGVAAVVAGFGNPQLAQDIQNGQPLLPTSVYDVVSFPNWVVVDRPIQSPRTALAYDSRAILVVLLAGFVIYRLFRLFRVRRRRMVVLVLVWLAIVVTSSLAGLLGAPLVHHVLSGLGAEQGSDPVNFAVRQATEGAVFGSAIGWLPALLAAMVAGLRRPRRASPQ